MIIYSTWLKDTEHNRQEIHLNLPPPKRVLVSVSQVSSIKIQVSISHTPEGPHTARERLTAAAEAATVEELAARKGSSKLRRRPIEGAGEVLRDSFPSKIELLFSWNKELRRIKSLFLKSFKDLSKVFTPGGIYFG